LAVLGAHDDATDATQEALIDAWCDLGSLRDPTRFPGWLRSIVQNRCRDMLRRASRRMSSHAPPASVPEAADAAHEVSRRALRDAVLTAIRSLSEPNRLAVTLFYIDGYSVQEVADFLETPVGTIKRRLHDSRRRLKEGMMDIVQEAIGGDKPGPELREQVRAELEARRAYWDSLSHGPADDGDVGWAQRHHDRRMEDVRANAAQYGIEPDETLPRMVPGYRQYETFRDDMKDIPRRWGVPEGINLVPLRDLCREVVASPLSIHRWEAQGLPVLRYWPWVLYDRERATKWVETAAPEPVQPTDAEDAKRPLLTVLEALAAGLATAEEGAELFSKLGSAAILRVPDPLWTPVWEAARDRERRANAAQYGLSEPADNWLGIPRDKSPRHFEIRDLTRRLGISPIDLVRYTRQGMPCLRGSPWVYWDIDRVTAWLAEHGVLPAVHTIQALDDTALFVCRAAVTGEAEPDEAYEALLGWYGIA
jgi:RNA polymerase sigma factor (sigma-70 family)